LLTLRKGLQTLDIPVPSMGQSGPRHWPRQNGEAIGTILMKFCYQCGKASAGDPPFCSKCGRSYDIRFCPRMHRNSRFAKACRECGSRELSEAQPQVSLWWKVLEFLAKVGFAMILLYASLALLIDLLRHPQVQAGFLVIGVLVGLIWWVCSQLPEWFRKFVWRSLRRKERDRER
jgi:predicted amidophosphoribosyltransferase